MIKRALANISGIDFEKAGTDDEVMRLRSTSQTPINFEQKYLTNFYGDLIEQSDRVLEIGCGCGRNAQYFANKPHIQYFGFDPSPKSLELFWINKFWTINRKDFYVSLTMDEKILSQKYDLIFSSYVFQHIGFLSENAEKHDSISIAQTLWPTLKPGGIWLSYELAMGQNGWNPHLWCKRVFDKKNAKKLHIGPAILKGNKGPPHDLILFRKRGD